MPSQTFTLMLRPTPSKGWRKAVLTRHTDPGFKFIGVLSVEEAKREGLKTTTRRYCVIELDPNGEGDRRFRLTKPMPNNGENYNVCLRATGDYGLCACVASLKSGECVHVTALRSFERAGNLPFPTKFLKPLGV